MSDKLTLFIAVTSAAVVLQMLILAGMYFTMRKLAARVEALSSEAESRLFPMLETIKVVQDDLKQFLATSRPNIEAVIENVKTITTGARTDFERVDATLNDILDRLRLQVIRGDEMVSRALDSVEQTTEKVQHTVLSPVVTFRRYFRASAREWARCSTRRSASAMAALPTRCSSKLRFAAQSSARGHCFVLRECFLREWLARKLR